ncbi:uncharacterized protein LAESUDRAFT_728705 [Laetiporus sulphureus 93-53]|uniref:Uncharacterized protein n=1 Tax=Laetiporus sulphureus 93-53 TaxID=1314785 RepID=A0A165D1Y6_9APHY|nr:uncharacterized protein LAESUDRAFT_728705 [Laetiporus sulphureus 93-53]KZT03991.1 hypothetical protein LAESUDRAFT_728705 [Laetiporus sulphureus 93-53]
MLPWSAHSQTTHLISDGQFIHFTGSMRNLRVIPYQLYSNKDSREFHAESIVDIPPICLRDIQQGDLSRMQLPALKVTGKQFGIKVSVRISIRPYNTHLNKQITIRRSTASSEYVDTYKLLEKIARLFLQFMEHVQSDLNIANEWGLFPTGRINVDRIFLLAIIRVAYGSIQPVFGTDV